VFSLRRYAAVPVFSRYAWRCVWSMIQNDLTHGWGLDLTWYNCAADVVANRSAVNGRVVTPGTPGCQIGYTYTDYTGAVANSCFDCKITL
jgi:hypothetical protein